SAAEVDHVARGARGHAGDEVAEGPDAFVGESFVLPGVPGRRVHPRHGRRGGLPCKATEARRARGRVWGPGVYGLPKPAMGMMLTLRRLTNAPVCGASITWLLPT